MTTDTTYRFAVAVEYEIGHVTFAKTLEAAVAEAHDVVADWHLMRSLPPEGWQRRWLGPRNYTLQMGARVRAALESHRRETNAVLIHTQTAALGCWRLMHRLPVVISTDATPRNIDELAAAYLHRQGSALEEEAKRRIVGSLFRRAAAVIPWCEWTARSLRDDYGVPGELIDVIPPGLWLDSWPVEAQRRPGPCRLLFVGGDFVRKGGESVLDCLQDLDLPWELDVVTRSEISGSDRIRVHRDLSQGDPRLLDLYQQADVFVFPSLGDAVPWVILEAMASRTAVISTAVGAIPEMVPPDAGIIVPANDGRRLRQAVSDLVMDSAKRDNMAAAGRRRVETHHDARQQAALIFERLRKVAV
jgi:glycosyltransferase involved in cell wall biosynthesis